MSSLTGGSSSTTWQLLWLVKIFVDEDRYWISYWNRSLTNENYGVSMIYREREGASSVGDWSVSYPPMGAPQSSQ